MPYLQRVAELVLFVCTGPSASARSRVDASQPSGVLGGVSAERSYSSAAGIAFEGSGVTASPASATAPQPSEQFIAAGKCSSCGDPEPARLDADR